MLTGSRDDPTDSPTNKPSNNTTDDPISPTPPHRRHHCRLAIEAGDTGESSRCLGVLRSLYDAARGQLARARRGPGSPARRGKSPAFPTLLVNEGEFASYAVLEAGGDARPRQATLLAASLPCGLATSSSAVRHALQLVARARDAGDARSFALLASRGERMTPHCADALSQSASVGRHAARALVGSAAPGDTSEVPVSLFSSSYDEGFREAKRTGCVLGPGGGVLARETRKRWEGGVKR